MKNKFLKCLSLILIGSMLTMIGCKSPATVFEPSYYANSRQNLMESIDYIGLVTGEESINKTMTNYKFGGTDLGIPVYNSKNDTMYVFFGDTFRNPVTMGGDWRSNVCLTSKDYNLVDGLSFNGAVPFEDGMAKQVAWALHEDEWEITKIPTGGIEIDGTLYMFFFSKYSWNDKTMNRNDSMNYGGCVKSTDNGETWERVFDLTWANHSELQDGHAGLYSIILEELINMNNYGTEYVGDVKLAEHVGYYFTQIMPIDGKDGYIYILGEGGYRDGGIKLGRVLKENFEKFNEYEYFTGFDAENNPVFEKGYEGLRKADESDDAFIIGGKNGKCGEHSIMYNQYLQKWVVTYITGNADGTNKAGIVLQTADNIYGPYDKQNILLGVDDVNKVCPEGYREKSIYGGFMHEKWTEQDGKVMYVIISQYAPIYNSSLLRVQFK
ncbi:MAG: DUF4185 domain-containing protein [Clostridiales bacterium]|nr:DUF4185 domain-containing protein [Clostridiales bacterium]